MGVHSCLSGISRAALGCSRRKFYVHRAALKCENGTDVIVKGTWHAD